MVNLELVDMKKPNRYRLFLFLINLFIQPTYYGQYNKLSELIENTFRLKSFEEQQDRYIFINDSLNNANLFKTEFAFINLMDKACKDSSNKHLEAIVLISKGNFYLSNANYIRGIETFKKALAIFAADNNYSGLSTVDANLGNAYFYMQDIDKALFYYNKAVSDIKKAGNKIGSETKLANCYNSLGTIYCSKGDFVFGRTYFDLAYNIWIKHDDSLSIGYLMNNYALIFYSTGKMDSALHYFNKALQLKLKFGNNSDKADAFNNLGDYYRKNKNLQLSLEYSFRALKFLDTTIFSRALITSYINLTETYNALKDYKNELKYYKLLKIANDSANIKGQQSRINQIELKNEFDRIHLTDSIKAVEEIKLKDAKISEKKQQSYLLIFILLLTVIALSLIYSRFKLTKKQKRLIEEKNKEITDSINYAKKIQQSSLPSEKYINKELKRLKEDS